MKPLKIFQIITTLILIGGWLVLTFACNPQEQESHTETPAPPVDLTLDEGESSCGSDETVDTKTAQAWIDHWQQKYESMNLDASEGVVKFAGFGSGELTSFHNLCEDCPYLYAGFAFESEELLVPRVILINVDANCEPLVSTQDGAMPTLMGTKNNIPSVIGMDYANAQDQLGFWETSFPQGLDSIPTLYNGYTFDWDEVQEVQDSCSALCPDSDALIRALFALHPDTLNGNNAPENLVIDLVFSCDCEGTTDPKPKWSKDFVDIANPCPTMCPTQ